MIDEFISKCKESEDGIYVIFCDHLTMDANLVIVVKNHEAVTPEELETGDGSEHIKAYKGFYSGTIELLMNSDSRFYGSIGFSHGMKMLKDMFPGMKTRYCNVGWYTFPHEWREIRQDDCYAKQCDEMFEVIHFEHRTEKDQ